MFSLQLVNVGVCSTMTSCKLLIIYFRCHYLTSCVCSALVSWPNISTDHTCYSSHILYHGPTFIIKSVYSDIISCINRILHINSKNLYNLVDTLPAHVLLKWLLAVIFFWNLKGMVGTQGMRRHWLETLFFTSLTITLELQNH